MRSLVVSKKGWVVIPQHLREKYNIKDGDRVNIVDYGNIISIIPLVKDPVRETSGLLKKGPSLTDALMSERKKERKYGK
jgi:AbrB family looped-hinge helix DNA binding protein